MEWRQRSYVTSLSAVIGFAAAFAWPALVPTRALWYYPLEHRWALELKPTGLAMDWYGRNVLAALVAVAFAALANAAARRMTSLSPRAHLAWAAVAALAVLASAAVWAQHLVHRHPSPVPLPAWYEPK
jgi:hypothetical protein